MPCLASNNTLLLIHVHAIAFVAFIMFTNSLQFYHVKLSHFQVEFGKVGFRTNRKLSKVTPDHLIGQRSRIKLWTVDKELKGWAAAQRKFFDAGQILDQIQADVGARRMEERKNKKR